MYWKVATLITELTERSAAVDEVHTSNGGRLRLHMKSWREVRLKCSSKAGLEEMLTVSVSSVVYNSRTSYLD